ncbi:hypothetical protein CRG98_020715, partial [Punica granatum]
MYLLVKCKRSKSKPVPEAETRVLGLYVLGLVIALVPGLVPPHYLGGLARVSVIGPVRLHVGRNEVPVASRSSSRPITTSQRWTDPSLVICSVEFEPSLKFVPKYRPWIQLGLGR